MSDLLEFFDDDSRAGFRLQRAEVYNWGTFHNKVWTLWARGRNTLLTGDIGSGKSTFVDAITTLLVPNQKISYNKAAGAENRERTLRTYLMGSYKSERGDEGGSSRAVGLRDARSYSVILAHFRNEAYNADVTLAQVFWFKDPQQAPARFHLVADRILSIVDDFSNFGSDINVLKKRLRAMEQVEVFDAFKDYQDGFRRRFGIENPQALELFHQTVSMKAIGNLTDFVRDHMLEAFDSQDRVDHLLTHFEDLNRAHEAVLRAKAQVAQLKPLVEDCRRLADAQGDVVRNREDREALRPWFAGLKADLLVRRLALLDQDRRRQEQKRQGLVDVRNQALAARDDLVRSIADNGGDRLLHLESQLDALRSETEKRRARSLRYATVADSVGLTAAEDAAAFGDQRSSLSGLKEGLRDQQARLQNQRQEADATFRDLRNEHRGLVEEIESIRNRPSNIPREQVQLRARLAAEFGIAPQELPFVGELLAVRDEFAPWEGAIERVLRSFALSLLVTDELYPRVSSWMDQNSLGTRVVYFRVRPVEGRSVPQADSLIDRVVVRNDSPHRDWLRAELVRRFDYVCCDDLDRFRRERQALTRFGQVKGGDRHEKDDRNRIDDRTRYVLGWSNQAKLAALEALESPLQARLANAGGELAALQSQESRVRERLEGLAALEGFTDFTDLDWRATVRLTADVEQQRDELRRSSSVLETLRGRLVEVEASLTDVGRGLDGLAREEGQTVEKVTVAQAALDEAHAVQASGSGLSAHFLRLDQGMEAALGARALTVESCESRQSDYRQFLQAQIDANEKRVSRLREKIVQAMKDFQTAFPAEARELDATPEAAEGYAERLATLEGDDLPRYEKEFKKLLNENTIREVAQFQASLARDKQTIVERMDRINLSLAQIDYNRGRYIRLNADPSIDGEVRDFYRELRACTDGSLTGSGDDQYAEAKFLQVRAILERFRHRPQYEELDRRWTEKVTDVRQAFVFSATERWREDDREHEHYTDSAGKSGGQKEKLAYTVLAASLAYQFGLEWGEVHSRTFRFVAIDEAFGRGSDESTRYGLSLFAKLNLQLLLITPLQKIPVIEPFVSAVGFVSNVDGRDSRLRNLTIEDYRAERQARAT